MTDTSRGTAALILLARLDSRRLPGKGLMDLGGRSVLGRAADRLRRCRQVPDMILATTDRSVDDPLEAWGAEEGIPVFRGDANDVAGRCLAACQARNLDWFIRICGDSPFIDPAVVDQVAGAFLSDPAPDLASNVFPRKFPIGCSAEAVSSIAMARICAETSDLAYLEHVTLWAYEHADRYMIKAVSPGHDRYANKQIAIDTPEDLEAARALIDKLPDPVTAGLDEILDALDR